MKYRNLFYTRAFKCIIVALISVLTWINSGYVTEMFTLQVTSRGAVLNVFSQLSGFDYETSEYVQQEIESTIDCVLDYGLLYSKSFTDGENSSYESYDYYMRLSNAKYKMTVEYLESLRGVNFAVVNHSTDTIVSSIPEIHNASAGTEIRQLFASDSHPFIIIRSCKNPYYEQGSLSEYVDYVREKAREYPDSFDLYLGFTEGLCFRESIGYYENMHLDFSDTVFSLMKKITVFSLAVIFLISLLVRLSGKAEKGGKIIPSFSDQLPSDLIIFFLLAIIGSAVALYNTSLYMLYKTSTIDGYGLGFRPETYAFRADVTLVIAVYVICALLCKIKRQRMLGTLYSGSYICLIRNMLRKRKEENQ